MTKLNARAPGLRPDRLGQVLDRIDNGLHEPLRVADLAEIACLSPFHFSRMFKMSTGRTPHAYITQRRMLRACDLLSNSTMTIGEIARRTGYRTQAHFTGAFRAYAGCPPGQYRESHRGKPVEIQAAGACADPASVPEDAA